ncbi:MAG: hypothetical protein J6S00_00375, partial [Clostridia bacterium]|nr:hypothetical protein [Clostridia bacterium]
MSFAIFLSAPKDTIASVIALAELVANSSLVALDQNLNLYYHSLASGQIYLWEKQSGKQGPCQNIST